jgi:bifunctional DNA-binding transcriptional regulator/antitoxin component of YhaV-PrlF toxin-antitoxin module
MSVAKVSEGGRVVIPADLREKYGLGVGATVVWAEDEHGLTLSSHRASIRRAQAIVAKYKRPGVDEVEEFLREKRAEAQRE